MREPFCHTDGFVLCRSPDSLVRHQSSDFLKKILFQRTKDFGSQARGFSSGARSMSKSSLPRRKRRNPPSRTERWALRLCCSWKNKQRVSFISSIYDDVLKISLKFPAVWALLQPFDLQKTCFLHVVFHSHVWPCIQHVVCRLLPLFHETQNRTCSSPPTCLIQTFSLTSPDQFSHERSFFNDANSAIFGGAFLSFFRTAADFSQVWSEAFSTQFSCVIITAHVQPNPSSIHV